MAVALQTLSPNTTSVNLRLQPTRPVLGKTSVEHDKVANILNTGNKEQVLPVLHHLSAAGKATIESLQVTECIGRLLRHKDPQVAAAAAEAIGVIGATGQRHGEALAALLQRPNDHVVTAALAAIGKMGTSVQPAQKALMVKQVSECLKGSVPVRVAALRTLAGLKATRQALSISELLQTEKVPEVAGAAVETLAQLANITLEAESCFPEDVREKKLGDMLSNPRTRHSALMALSHLGSKAPASLMTSVAEALSDDDLSIRYAATLAIGAMAQMVASSDDTVSQLMAMVKNQDPNARAAAASAMAAMGPEAAQGADLVATLVQDMEEADVQQQTTSAGQRAPPQMLMPRCAAVTALGCMKAQKHADAVAQGLLDKNWHVRVAAANALGQLGEGARAHASSLIGCLSDDAYLVRAAVCTALGALNAPEALPGLAQAFEDSSHVVRSRALDAAAELVGDAEEYCHEVFKASGDSNNQVRASAVRCLARHRELGPSYAGVVARFMTDVDPDVRAAAAVGLGFLGAAGRCYEDEVNALMNDSSEVVRQACAHALEQMGLRAGMGPLKPLAARNHSAVKAAMAPPPERKDPVEGLGQYYKSIMMRKSDLEKSGKWIDEDVF